MARYLVGADDDKPSLIDAVRNASDGDIIELEEGYCPNVNYITLSKSLSFIGHVVKTEEGREDFRNTITSRFFIEKGASVSFKGLWICCGEPKCNIINCNRKSKLEMTNVVIESTQTEEKVYPVIYAEEECQIKFKDVTVWKNEKWSLKSYFENCNVEIDDSVFCDCNIVAKNTEIKIKNSAVRSVGFCVVNAYNSNVTLNNVSVEGCDKEKRRPAIWSENSRIITSNCTVTQPEYESAVYLIKNSYLQSDDDDFESVCMDDSRGICTASKIRNIFSAESQSYVCMKEGMEILGNMSRKIDLLLDENSVFRGDVLRLNRIVNPNLRIKGSCFIFYDTVKNLEIKTI